MHLISFSNIHIKCSLFHSIFNLIPRVRAKPSSYITGQVDPMRHIPRVCKAWFNPATEVLYKFVCVPRVNAAMLLYRTLTAKAHPDSLLGFLKDKAKRGKKGSSERKGSGLGGLVRVLLLPKRVWVGCPPRLVLLFTRIIGLCDSLDEIQVICTIAHDERFSHQVPRYPLPIPLHKHTQLKSLALANAEATLWTNFPIFSNQFPELEELCLSGFRISNLVRAEEVGPLPKLRSIRLESCDIGTLEGWLATCPLLRTLEIDLSVWTVGPDGGIFGRDMLTSLQWSRTSTPIDLNHVAKCKNLRLFTTDYPTFRHQWELVPPNIAHLLVIFRDADTPSKQPFSDFFEAAECVNGWGRSAQIQEEEAEESKAPKESPQETRLERLTVRIAMANPWIVENAEWLKGLCKEKGVQLELDLTKFGPRESPRKPSPTICDADLFVCACNHMVKPVLLFTSIRATYPQYPSSPQPTCGMGVHRRYVGLRNLNGHQSSTGSSNIGRRSRRRSSRYTNQV